ATPVQTATGTRVVGVALNLEHGAATGWDFMGWALNASATDLADAAGMTWPAATAVAGPLTAILATANMPTTDTTVTAVWGRNGVIGDARMLTVENFPTTITLNATPVQTASGARIVGTALNLAHGAATGWDFMGWALNPSATDLADAAGMTWAAATAGAGPLTAILATDNMPATDTTVTAVWGRNGVIGDSRLLTVQNFPTTITLDATPVQTTGGARIVGTALNLASGAATGWDFMGWALNPSAADLATASGMTWAAATAGAGPLTEILATANMPAADTTVTAVWGRNGVIGDVRMLTVENFPTTITLNATPVQSATGTRPVGVALNLISGAAIDWTFMGWALNASAADLAAATGMTWAAATAGAGPLTAIAATANMPNADTTVTAVWGRNGIIGDARLLTVGNFPTNITLNATPAQTASGARIVGTALNLVSGAATNWEFLGWAQGASAADLAASTGMTWAAATAGAGPLTEILATANMPDANTTVTAVWGVGGIIGGGNHTLTILNYPPTVNPTGQTPSGTRQVGQALNLQPGTVVNWNFLGWTTDASEAVTGQTAPGTFPSAPPANMPNISLTVIGVWGNDAGVIGIPNTPPVTPTPQSPRRPSAGIWAPPRPLNVVEVDPITELEPIQEDRIMRMIPAYVSGFPDGSFMPNGSATRAEVAAMLYRLLDQTNARRPMTSNSTFSDVSSDAWYYHFVTTLAAMDVITGYPDGTFRPNQPITRAELTSLVTRFVQASNMTANNRFTDLNSSHWAFGFIMQAYGHGWIVGYPDGTFRPDANITRAEAVTVINNATNRHQHAHLLRFTEYFTDVNGHWAYNNIMLAAEDLIWFE
ncbi:MAG: S-layer homology domain-containing protein, partial [Defluviitaleaceae bacterium]|nr:S-layer homology domain-containing protein [Defluviitaleaceae bacterium]